jgi:DNA-binding winged helix-turn-helix (wHTH) protein/tetratricopeptide (TPR) repeat protein
MDRPAAWRAIAVDLEAEGPFRVGGATVDPVSRDAEYPGGHERLQPQTLKVLIALVRKKGVVITRSDLINSCWGGRVVGEDVINRSVSILRDFAGRAGGFTIETVPKAGYRLIESSRALTRPRRVLSWASPLALLAAAGLGAWLASRWEEGSSVKPPSVALRPITSSSDASSRDLAAAAGDALSHMMVAGSFHGKLAWPATSKDEAAADIILSGDIRRTGGTFAALMQVRDRRTGTVLFSRRYEATTQDASLLPEQIGAEMSSNLTGALALMVLDRRHSDTPELTADKLKSIAITVSGDDPLAGYEISRRIAEKQPDSLLAQLGLAYDTAFALSSLPKAQRAEAVRKARLAADKALRMAPEFGDTYGPWCHLHPATQSRECEDRLRAGMKADPDAPFTPVFLSSLLFNVGRFEESSQFARTGLAGDPFHPHKLRRVVRTKILLGQKEEAEHLFSKAIRWWPNHEGLHWDHIYAYALTGDLAGAEQAIRQLPPAVLDRDRVEISSMLLAHSLRDLSRLRTICLDADAGFLVKSLCLTALHSLNDRDGAIDVAEQLFPRAVGTTPRESEAIWLDDPYIGIEPMLAAPAAKWLRSDPRFLALAERSGAISYWRDDRLPDFCRERPEPVCGVLVRRWRGVQT